jgi:glycosyltransferase involved in cell wall biosynthesis
MPLGKTAKRASITQETRQRMDVRKVLLLTYHFPPSGAVAVYRMLGLARYLPRFGWQPIVVAPPRVPWEPEDPSLLTQVPPETLVERVPFAEGFLGKIARYLAPEAHWLLKARPACNRMIAAHRPHAIITSSPPGCVHLLGRWLQKRHALPWLADFRDPWITNRKLERRTMHDRLAKYWEAEVMKHATTLIANTPLNHAGWAAAYPQQAHKMVTITNGYDPERFTPVAYAPGSPLTILHAGEFYSGRDPRPFFDAIKEERLPVQVRLLGRQTESICNFPNEIRTRGLGDCVTLEDQVPYATAIERMMHTDINLLVHTPEYRVGVPAKLYEYLGAGRPILALAEPDSDIGWVLRASKVLHRIAPPRDVARIRQALVELTREIQAGQAPIPDANALRQFTRERMAERIAECLDACAPRREPVEVAS